MRAKRRILPSRRPLSDCTNDVASRINLKSSLLSDVGKSEELEASTVYTRKRSAENRRKGDADTFPARGSPIRRMRNIGEQEHDDGDTDLAKLQTAPQQKKQRQESVKLDVSKDPLSEYLEQQKAYFEAVDAEELQEGFESDNEVASHEGLSITDKKI